jgi:hypothetical protein
MSEFVGTILKADRINHDKPFGISILAFLGEAERSKGLRRINETTASAQCWQGVVLVSSSYLKNLTIWLSFSLRLRVLSEGIKMIRRL